MQRQVWALLSAEGIHGWQAGTGAGSRVTGRLGQEEEILTLSAVEISLFSCELFWEKNPRKINKSLVSRQQLGVWASVFLPPAVWLL